MTPITFDELLKIATELSRKSLEWHHHFLTPSCALNADEDYRIMLETSQGNYYVAYDNKPLDDLEKLENLFFGR